MYIQGLEHYSDFGHIGFVVRDMEQALKKWSQIATLIIPPTIDPVQEVVCSLFVMRGAAPIELIAPQPGDEDSKLKSRLARGGGLDHLCFYVDDVSLAFQQRVNARAVGICEPVYGCVFDREIAFVQERNGLTVEFMSRQAKGRMEIDPLADLNINSRQPRAQQ